MDRLDEVAGAGGPDPGAARLATVARGDVGEDPGHALPGALGAARHDRRPMPGAVLAARYSDAEKADVFCRPGRAAPLGIVKIGIAGIDEDIAAREARFE